MAPFWISHKLHYNSEISAKKALIRLGTIIPLYKVVTMREWLVKTEIEITPLFD